MNISLAAEPIFHLFGTTITNSILTGWIISIIFISVAVFFRLRLNKRPSRGQTVLELAYDGFLDMVTKVVGREDVAAELFPFIITAFFFIVISNCAGLLPGISAIGFHQAGEITPLFRSPTTDLNTTIALAVISVCYVQYMGIKYRGTKKYLHTFFNFSDPIFFFVGIIELVSEITRIISYSFRLFGNIFAGEVLIMVITYLTSSLLPFVPILPIPFIILELFICFIQAFVFCFLTIVFTSIAVTEHDDPHHAEAPAIVVTTPALNK